MDNPGKDLHILILEGTRSAVRDHDDLYSSGIISCIYSPNSTPSNPPETNVW